MTNNKQSYTYPERSQCRSLKIAKPKFSQLKCFFEQKIALKNVFNMKNNFLL